MGLTLHSGQVGLSMWVELCYAGNHLQDDTIHHHSYGTGLTPGLSFLFEGTYPCVCFNFFQILRMASMRD